MPTFRILNAQEAHELDEYDYEDQLMLGRDYTIERLGVGNRVMVNGQTYEQVSPNSHWFVLVHPEYEGRRVGIIIPEQEDYGKVLDGFLTLIIERVIDNAHYSDFSEEEEGEPQGEEPPAVSDDDDSSEDSSRYDGLNPGSRYQFTWKTEPKILINGEHYVKFSDHLYAKVPDGGPPVSSVFVSDMIRFEDEDIPDEDTQETSDYDENTMDTSAGGRRKKSYKKSYRKKRSFKRVVSKKRKSNKRTTRRSRKTKSKRRKTRRRR